MALVANVGLRLVRESENGQISGDVLVYWNPGLHFGDIHILRATYVKGLESFVGHSRYAIFFPSPLLYRNRFVKGAHSLHQPIQKRPITPFGWKNSKSMKPDKEVTDHKEYTRDIVAKIYRMLKYSTWDSAQEELEKLPIRWDSYTVNQILKTHPPMEKAWLFFNWASRLRGFKHDQYTYTTMLDIFGEAGRISSMKYVFQQMLEKAIKIDSVTYTSLMHWLSNSGNVDEAIKAWEEMKSKGCTPTVVSYTAYMKILFNNDKVKEATNVFKEMLQSECTPNCYTYTILMEHLIGSEKCKEALDVFEKMQEAGVQPDKAACNILVQKCSKVGGTAAMNQFLQYMKENRLVLRYTVFVEALEALKLAGESDALLREVHPHFSVDYNIRKNANYCTKVVADSPSNIDERLLSVLLRKRNLVAIDHLLAMMTDKKIPLNKEALSTIIDINCSQYRPDGALLAFEYSVKLGISLDRAKYLALVGLLIRSNLFSKILEIVEEMTRAGHSLGIYLASNLLYRLGRARQPTYAAKIFNLLPDNHKCTATYTALISAYFSAGRVNKALGIYENMRREGVSPALGTYNVLLDGMERNGKSSEAELFRKERKTLLARNSLLKYTTRPPPPTGFSGAHSHHARRTEYKTQRAFPVLFSLSITHSHSNANFSFLSHKKKGKKLKNRNRKQKRRFLSTMATDPNEASKVISKAITEPSVYLDDAEELKRVFSRFDVNGDGKISITELDNVLKTLGSSVPQSQLKNVMEDLDTDRDGFINLSEFAEFCRSNATDGGSSELRDAFDLYDQDKNGLISASELHQVLNRLGLRCSVDECRDMIKSVDADGDGSVNFEEFKKMMTNNPMNASVNPDYSVVKEVWQQNIIIESDSLLGISLIKDGVDSSHPLNPIVSVIRSLAAKVGNVSFNHSFREGNRVANGRCPLHWKIHGCHYAHHAILTLGILVFSESWSFNIKEHVIIIVFANCGVSSTSENPGGVDGSEDVVMVASEREGYGLMTRRPGPRRRPWSRCVLEKRGKELYDIF
ncbi:pentatricopeptide repeat-containing protein [Senna tora]|uniref:RNA-dependent RNA polymerase n=1 Tax=Senna tora TaxID=362788 RepID=A0A834TJI2_9FABA|nr:pentatricopeptide repeat-containing protein [Senna tora]